MSCAALSVRPWLVLLLLLLCAYHLIVNLFPCPFRGRGLNQIVMYRIYVKKTKRGRWLRLWNVSSPCERSYEIFRALEKCEICAYKVECSDLRV